MTTVAKAFVELIPTARGFTAKMDREIGGDVDSLGRDHGKRYGDNLSTGLGAAGGLVTQERAYAMAGSLAGVAPNVNVGSPNLTVLVEFSRYRRRCRRQLRIQLPHVLVDDCLGVSRRFTATTRSKTVADGGAGMQVEGSATPSSGAVWLGNAGARIQATGTNVYASALAFYFRRSHTLTNGFMRLFFGGDPDPSIEAGTGSPEGVHPGSKGSIFLPLGRWSRHDPLRQRVRRRQLGGCPGSRGS